MIAGADIPSTSLSAPRAPGHGRRAVTTAVLMAASLAAIWFVAALLVDNAARGAAEKARTQADVAARVLEQFMLRTLDGIEANFTLLRARLLMQQAGNEEAAGFIGASLAETTAAGRFGLLQIAAVGPDGWLRWSTLPGFSRIDVSDREHVRVQLTPGAGLHVSAPVLGRASGRSSVQVTRRIEDETGTLLGIAVMSIDPQALSRQLAQTLPDPRDELYVLAVDGAVIAQSGGAGGLIGGASAIGQDRIAAILREGRLAFRGPSPIDGTDRFNTIRVVAGAPLLVGTGINATAALAPVAGITRLSAAVALLTSLLVVLLALAARRRHERLHTRAELERARLAEAGAEAARAEIEALLAGLPIAVFRGRVSAGRGLEVTFASAAMAELSDPSLAPARAGFLASLLRGRDATVEYEVPRPGRAPLWLREAARVVAIRPSGTEVVGYRADITAERHFAAQAAEASKLATLGEMATGLAHELNQPVTAMALGADNAADALETEGAAGIAEAVTTLRHVAGQAERARAIIDHLRVFGRRDPGPLGPVGIARAVDGALMLAGGALRSAGIEVVRDIPADLPLVQGQLVLLEQVLVNLCLNARDAMVARPEGPRRLTIEARTAPGRRVLLTVRDTGGGVPAEIEDRIFEPFFTTKPVGQGTGLGLAICHGMMAAVGGAIRFANCPGGAEFVLVLTMTEPG